jgi:hypothetical protein
MTMRWITLLSMAFILSAVPTMDVSAASIFEDPENLEVLPEDISPQDLRATMRGFTQDLGVRCSFCHEGREGEPLSTYDFATDRNKHKRITREMMRMVSIINEDLIGEMDPSTDGDVAVTCLTCHRGQKMPFLITDHLDEALDDGDEEDMIERYEELRAQFYGGFTYDFSELNLISYAEELAARGERAAAMAVVETNLRHHPESEWSLISMAQLLVASGDRAGAVERLDQALAINPDNELAADLRNRLTGG